MALDVGTRLSHVPRAHTRDHARIEREVARKDLADAQLGVRPPQGVFAKKLVPLCRTRVRYAEDPPPDVVVGSVHVLDACDPHGTAGAAAVAARREPRTGVRWQRIGREWWQVCDEVELFRLTCLRYTKTNWGESRSCAREAEAPWDCPSYRRCPGYAATSLSARDSPGAQAVTAGGRT